MHSSLASVLAGTLVLPLLLLSSTGAQAEHRKATKTSSVTIKTDAMPTRVVATTAGGRVTCVRVATGSGRERRVWITLKARRDGRAYVRVPARTTSKCLLAGATALRGARLVIRVEEHLPGPFKVTAGASLRL